MRFPDPDDKLKKNADEELDRWLKMLFSQRVPGQGLPGRESITLE
ncbi:MAG: hypothetical protein Q8J78_05955 [Moraxellaceae bacterium]|nr:hypothetical protein [Moraxellaceae bacterium]